MWGWVEDHLPPPYSLVTLTFLPLGLCTSPRHLLFYKFVFLSFLSFKLALLSSVPTLSLWPSVHSPVGRISSFSCLVSFSSQAFSHSSYLRPSRQQKGSSGREVMACRSLVTQMHKALAGMKGAAGIYLPGSQIVWLLSRFVRTVFCGCSKPKGDIRFLLLQ